MPAIVVAVAAAASGAAAATALGFVAGTLAYAAVSAVVGMVVSSVLSGALGLNKKPKQPQIEESVDRGQLLNTAGTVDPICVVYGKRRMGGTRCLAEVSGSGNEYLHLVIAHCEGEIEAIDAIYLDDVISTDPKFSGLVYYETFTGADDQEACATLVEALPGKWTANHRLRGVAYSYIRLKYDGNVFRGLPTITADIRGRKVYDPRDGMTRFSDSPALCTRDYLTNHRFGRGIAEADIDDATFITEANYGEQSITTPSGDQKRYTCNGIVYTSDNSVDNMQKLMTCCRGMLIYSAGQYKLRIDKPENPTFTFDEDNIVGAWTIALRQKRGSYNRVRGSFFNPDRNWQPDLAVADSPDARAEDNGLMLEDDIDLPFTSNPYQAQILSDRYLKQSRFGITASFRSKIEGLRCEVGEVVYITHSTPGWVEKPFRILRMGLLNSDEVEVNVREYDASVYAEIPLTAPRVSPVTNLPDPTSVMPVGAVTLTSGTDDLFITGAGTVVSRIRVSWPEPLDQFVRAGGQAQVQYRPVGTDTWLEIAPIDNGIGPAYISPVEDGLEYEVRVRFQNSAGARSGWEQPDPHIVAGKSLPPSNVTGFFAQQQGGVVVFGCDNVADTDLDLVEVRLLDYGDTQWSNGLPKANILRGHTITSAAIPPGVWTFLACAKDSSGNYSGIPARIDLSVTADGYTSIRHTEAAPSWIGTLVNFVVHHTGVLVPKGQHAAGSYSGNEWIDHFSPDPFEICSFEMAEVDKGIDMPARIWGDIISTLGPGETEGISNPRFQVDHRTSAGSYSGYVDWVLGTASFRYLKARMVLDTTQGISKITGFFSIIDRQPVTEEKHGLVIAPGGTTVLFDNEFHSVPGIANPMVTALNDGGAPRLPTHEGDTAAGTTLRMFNTAGADVGGTGGYRATGV